MKKYTAFTLAEMIVTIGIIGVIAAMTLPTLFGSITNNVYAVRIKQVYSQLYSALSTYMAANDIAYISPQVMRLYSDDSTEISVNNFVMQSFHNAKNCAIPSPMCFGSRYTINGVPNISPSNFTPFWRENSSFLLNNGASISIIPLYGGNSKFRVVVDVNNARMPNRIGRDLWVLYIDNDGSLTTSGPIRGNCDTDYDACLNNLKNNNWKPDF